MSLKDIKCFLLDMDGTLYLGDSPVEGALDAVHRMKKQARVLFVTNNSSVSSADYYKKLTAMGFELSANDIYGSTRAATDYLNGFHAGKTVYLCAAPRVTAEFAAAGIKLFDDNLDLGRDGGGDCKDKAANGKDLKDALPDIVCLTFDKTLTYDKLQRLCYFLDNGAMFVVTHPDRVCPVKGGGIPDIGCFLKAVECATGRKPDVVCGKPRKLFGQSIQKLTGLKPREIAMVGDRLSTDLKFAKNCGFTSVTVLSGEATLADVDGIKRLKDRPDFVLGSIADWDKPV